MREATEGAFEGRFLVQRAGRGYAARVTIVLERGAPGAEVVVACSGAGWVAQGVAEDVGATGYEDWKEGARAGVAFALRAAGLAGCAVRVTRIVGMTSDTNATIVAAAAARAVWRAAGVTPAAEVLVRVEAATLASWSREGLDVFAG